MLFNIKFKGVDYILIKVNNMIRGNNLIGFFLLFD